MKEPAIHATVETLVDEIIARRGRSLTVALPLGLGKPAFIINELVERALGGGLDRLTIFTALSLQKPHAAQLLERRLMEPIVDRLYGDYPDLTYARLRAQKKLPDNIRVHEFYVAPGSILGLEQAQQDYLSINYTQAFRIASEEPFDAFLQMVAPADGGYDLGGNTDISLDLIPAFNRRADKPLVVGQVNRALPGLGGSAIVPEESFDLVLDDSRYEHRLFSAPEMPPSDAEYAIGIRVASLLADDGTIQLGIGNLGDTVSWAALQRHHENEQFLTLLDALGVDRSEDSLASRIGGTEPFSQGLYCCSEMLTGGLIELFKQQVLRRRTDDGVAIHAAFYFGAPRLYETLRALSDEERAQISMTSVRWTNALYGDEEQKRKERRRGRFINETMKVSLLGAATSDQLENGEIVSGVGGQFEFVTMANALADGRAILMLPSVRESGGERVSNIVWRYGQTTIPRHLRDLVVTEYGVADLRDKSDREVIEAMLCIADRQFQRSLAEQAIKAGKLPSDYAIPEAARNNTPKRLAAALAPMRSSGVVPRCPFGSALSETELDLVEALQHLQRVVDVATSGGIPSVDLEDIWEVVTVPREAEPYLRRMGLHEPETTAERAYRRLLIYALASRDIL